MEIPQDKMSRWKDLRARITGIIPLLFIVVLCVIQGGFWFTALVLIATAIMLKEWDGLTKNETINIKLAGYPLIILPCACLIWLRSLSAGIDTTPGMKLVFTLIAVIAATDIGAYFTGKLYGKTKLAPVVSPNKTWEGLVGGVFAAMLIASLLLPLSLPFFMRCGIGMLLALLAQTGDIIESAIKRRAGVKDSGNIISGHGGLLDRVDGYLLAAPAFALLVHVYIL